MTYTDIGTGWRPQEERRGRSARARRSRRRHDSREFDDQGSIVAAPDAPIWLSGTSTTPQLQQDFPDALTTGDQIETQFSTAVDFSTVEQDVTHIVTSGENGSSTITGVFSALLTTATYYARDRYKLGSGQWSNWSAGTSQAIVASGDDNDYAAWLAAA